jgi:hypothetical protein
MRKHPMQPVVIAGDGCARFKENEIVRFLLQFAERRGTDLNSIAAMDFSRDDYSQLMQLIGYSISGYGDLDCANRRHVHQADRNAAKL